MFGDKNERGERMGEWGWDCYPEDYIGKETPCEFELLRFNIDGGEWECQGIYAEDEETITKLVNYLEERRKNGK